MSHVRLSCVRHVNDSYLMAGINHGDLNCNCRISFRKSPVLVDLFLSFLQKRSAKKFPRGGKKERKKEKGKDIKDDERRSFAKEPYVYRVLFAKEVCHFGRT